jgi:hypothetical protein
VIVVQEEIDNKSIALYIKAGKITAQLLAKALVAIVHKVDDGINGERIGAQSLKRLSKGGTLSSIEITDDNIKAFDPIARKYGIGYSLQKDSSTDPPRWLVLFKCKDVDAMTAAFKEFSKKTLTKEADKPSVRDTMREHKEMSKNAVKVKIKQKDRGVPEL